MIRTKDTTIIHSSNELKHAKTNKKPIGLELRRALSFEPSYRPVCGICLCIFKNITMNFSIVKICYRTWLLPVDIAKFWICWKIMKICWVHTEPIKILFSIELERYLYRNILLQTNPIFLFHFLSFPNLSFSSTHDGGQGDHGGSMPDAGKLYRPKIYLASSSLVFIRSVHHEPPAIRFELPCLDLPMLWLDEE